MKISGYRFPHYRLELVVAIYKHRNLTTKLNA